MPLYQLFPLTSAPEYNHRLNKPFTPPTIPISVLHAAVPKHLWRRSTTLSLFYVARHVAVTWAFYAFACKIDVYVAQAAVRWGTGVVGRTLLSWALWTTYWVWQGIAFAGTWCLAHEVRSSLI